VVVGCVLAFKYLTGKGKKTVYSEVVVVAPVKAPQTGGRGLACLCAWYFPSDDGVLQQFGSPSYVDVSSYICALSAPSFLVVVKHYILKCTKLLESTGLGVLSNSP